MRVAVNIYDNIQVYDVYSVIACTDSTILIKVKNENLDILIDDVYDTKNVINRLTTTGWCNLTDYYSHELCKDEELFNDELGRQHNYQTTEEIDLEELCL